MYAHTSKFASTAIPDLRSSNFLLFIDIKIKKDIILSVLLNDVTQDSLKQIESCGEYGIPNKKERTF